MPLITCVACATTHEAKAALSGGARTVRRHGRRYRRVR
jgi:hypothetical protein